MGLGFRARVGNYSHDYRLNPGLDILLATKYAEGPFD